MSSGLTRSSRPQVRSVGAVTLCIIAQGIGASDARIAAIICPNAALPYIRRALSSVCGSVASAQRSSINASVTSPGLYTIDCNQSMSRWRVGFSVNELQEPDALARTGREDVLTDSADCDQ